MVPLLYMIGGTLVRAAGPTIARELAKLGAKKLAGRAATEAAKKGTAKLINNSNIGVVRTLARPGAKVADKVDDLAAGVSRTIGRGQKLGGRGTKPKPSTTATKPKTTAKPSTTAKPKTATGAGKPTMAKPKTTAGGRGRKPGTTAKPKTRPTTPPPRPTTGGPKSVVKPLLGAASVAGTIMGASTLGSGDKGKSKAAMPLPKPRPQVQGPPPPPKKKKANPPAGKNLIKATMFDKGKNTGFGVKGNSFVGGPAERAVMMKYYGGTGSQAAKAALAGTQGQLKKLGMDALRKERQAAKIKDMKARQASGMDNKYKGGKIGEKSITMTRLKPGMMSKKKAMRDFLKKPKQTKKTGRGKGKIPSSYLGFSKLPESVQKRMDPALAAKYGEGGSIKSGVARQIRGWGKARKPKR